jgi:hypothetical protein
LHSTGIDPNIAGGHLSMLTEPEKTLEAILATP